jgi:hypothetical protein
LNNKFLGQVLINTGDKVKNVRISETFKANSEATIKIKFKIKRKSNDEHLSPNVISSILAIANDLKYSSKHL